MFVKVVDQDQLAWLSESPPGDHPYDHEVIVQGGSPPEIFLQSGGPLKKGRFVYPATAVYFHPKVAAPMEIQQAARLVARWRPLYLGNTRSEMWYVHWLGEWWDAGVRGWLLGDELGL